MGFLFEMLRISPGAERTLQGQGEREGLHPRGRAPVALVVLDPSQVTHAGPGGGLASELRAFAVRLLTRGA